MWYWYSLLSWERIFPPGKMQKQEQVHNTGTAQATVTENWLQSGANLSNSLPCLTAVLPLPFIPCPSITKRTEDGKKSTPLWWNQEKPNIKQKRRIYPSKSRKKQIKNPLYLWSGEKTSLSIALKGKKLKQSKAKISNPKKTTYTDVLNQNKVTYKKVLKNTNVSYDIFPEKVQEIVTVSKKQKNKSFSFKLNTKLKVKVKGKKVYFKTKKGKTKFTRMSTKITDANGVSTTNVKLFYNKKTKTLKVTPNKKWWNSKKRKFPVEIRTTYLTDKHRRDVKVGAAYAGAPNSNSAMTNPAFAGE